MVSAGAEWASSTVGAWSSGGGCGSRAACGREEQVLATRRELGQDPLDVGQEAHVEHVVRLVEDQDLDAVELGVPLAHQVEQATGAGHDDLGPSAQPLDLGVLVHAPEDRDRAHARVLGEGLELAVDLDGEPHAWREDQGARVRPLLPQAMQDRECEGGRLAGARLGEAEDVAAVDDLADGLGLDGARLLVARLLHGPEDAGVEPEGGEAALRTLARIRLRHGWTGVRPLRAGAAPDPSSSNSEALDREDGSPRPARDSAVVLRGRAPARAARLASQEHSAAPPRDGSDRRIPVEGGAGAVPTSEAWAGPPGCGTLGAMQRLALGLLLALSSCASLLGPREPSRVLLLGDSISIGYHRAVVEALGDDFVVVRPMANPEKGRAENCEGTTKGVKAIERWLALEGGDWDVIHFNFGLHDLKRVDPKTRRNRTIQPTPTRPTSRPTRASHDDRGGARGPGAT